MNIKIKNRALSHVGNGFQPFQSPEAVGRGPRTRRFPDCSGNSPYNGEQSEGHATVHTTGNSPYNIHFLRKLVKSVGTV
jgi:hypothetical protein